MMNEATVSALRITAAALPLMFATTGVFVVVCKVLCLLFPTSAQSAVGKGEE